MNVFAVFGHCVYVPCIFRAVFVLTYCSFFCTRWIGYVYRVSRTAFLALQILRCRIKNLGESRWQNCPWVNLFACWLTFSIYTYCVLCVLTYLLQRLFKSCLKHYKKCDLLTYLRHLRWIRFECGREVNLTKSICWGKNTKGQRRTPIHKYST